MAAITRTSTVCVRSAPSGSNSRSCSTRSSFDCTAGLSVPISSRKIEPPSASANLPRLVAVAPVKAPRTWPKSSDSSSVSGIAAQFTLMSGISRCALWWWISRATISLPVPVSPVMSTVLLVCATSAHALQHLLHHAAAPDDAVVVELGVPLADQVLLFRPQPVAADRPARQRQQLVHLERLLEEVLDAQLEGVANDLGGAVRGHQHQLRPLAVVRGRHHLAHQVEARHARHQVVHDHQVELAFGDAAQRFARVRRQHHVVAVVLEGAAQPLQDLLFVVDEQDRPADYGHAALSRRPQGQVDAHVGADVALAASPRCCRPGPR